MSNLRDRLAKLEALTEARGATPAEAERARELAAKLRARLQAEPQPHSYGWDNLFTEPHSSVSFWQAHRKAAEEINEWLDSFKRSGRRVVSPAWDPALQGKVFK